MAQYNPCIHHRRSIRLQDYDYRQAGAYFITICTYRRESAFGEITDNAMHCNAYGSIVAEDWEWLARHYESIDLDAFVIMPNHLHGIVVMTGPGAVVPRRDRPYETARAFDRRVQDGIDQTRQGMARNARRNALAARFLRTHHPQR